MVYSDRGGQYVGNAYKALLYGAQAQLSHSRRGECDDNAEAENRPKVLSACGPASKLKNSKRATGLSSLIWPVPRPVSRPIFDHCNHERCHSSMGYQNLINFSNSNLIISPNSLLGGGL